MRATPMDFFSRLLDSCISDASEERKAKDALEGAGVLLLGIVCSLVTAYVLASLGLIV